jgi:hypothetical protein
MLSSGSSRTSSSMVEPVVDAGVMLLISRGQVGSGSGLDQSTAASMVAFSIPIASWPCLARILS